MIKDNTQEQLKAIENMPHIKALYAKYDEAWTAFQAARTAHLDAIRTAWVEASYAEIERAKKSRGDRK